MTLVVAACPVVSHNLTLRVNEAACRSVRTRGVEGSETITRVTGDSARAATTGRAAGKEGMVGTCCLISVGSHKLPRLIDAIEDGVGCTGKVDLRVHTPPQDK